MIRNRFKINQKLKVLIAKISNKRFITFIDFQLMFIAYLVSFILRFDFKISSEYLRIFFITFPLVLAIKIAVYIIWDIHRIIWRYTGIRDLVLIIKASTINNLIYALLLFLLFQFEGYPRSIIIIDWFLFIMLLGGVRLFYRYFLKNISIGYEDKKRCLIIGSRDAAEALIRSMLTNEIKYIPVGILDDDRNKWNRFIHGIKIYGAIKDVYEVANKLDVEEIIIAITSATSTEMRQILNHLSSCDELNIRYKIVPGINEILSGHKSLTAIREVKFEDLINRELVVTDQMVVRKELENKVVLITGAAGSIGSELSRQIAHYQPSNLILIDRNENNLMYLEKELESNIPSLCFHTQIIDITDELKLEKIFKQYTPDYVFHAAAYKHVSYMEKSPDEAVNNNVYGTYHVAKLAEKYNTLKFVLISTDKAVNPINIMGCSKRLAELCILNLFKNSSSKYVIVRFGNVLGSEGSVIPIFKKQIENGGPVTITHPKMKRYFMSIPEAVRLTLHAAYLGDHGDILILDMGEQISILEIAENLIKLSGFKPHKDIKINFTGVRPGEKLYEELWNYSENPIPTPHPKIFKTTNLCSENKFDFSEFNELINMSLKHDENQKIINHMKRLVGIFGQETFVKKRKIINDKGFS